MRPWPKHALIYEINTWVWLDGISRKAAHPLTLASVPDEEWDRIASPGFDAVWLMGVWERSPEGMRISMENEGLLADFRQAVPDLSARNDPDALAAEPPADAGWMDSWIRTFDLPLPWRGGFAKEGSFPSAPEQPSSRSTAGESAASGTWGYAVLNHPAIREEKGGEKVCQGNDHDSSIIEVSTTT